MHSLVGKEITLEDGTKAPILEIKPHPRKIRNKKTGKFRGKFAMLRVGEDKWVGPVEISDA